MIIKKTELTHKDVFISFASVLLGIFAVSLALFGGFNFGLTIYFVSALIFGTIYFKEKGKKTGAFGIILFILSFLGSFVFTITADFLTNFTLFFILCISIFSYFHILKYGSGNLGDLKLIPMLFYSSFLMPIVNLWVSMKSLFSGRRKSFAKYRKLFVGLLFAVPFLLIIIPLLISGDAAFEGLLKGIGFKEIFPFTLKALFGIIISPIIFSFFFANKKNEKDFKFNVSLDKVKIDSLYGISFLFAIALCYLTYLFSQLAYLFGGLGGILPEEFTMAEYAKRGFFEITAIAIINFIIMGCAHIFFKRDSGVKTNLLKGFMVFIGIFTLLLITTAIAKMVMYIDRFGMTYLRITTSLFLIFIFILCATLTLRSLTRKVLIIRPALITALVILTLIGTVGTKRLIADYNTYAYFSGNLKTLDVETIANCGNPSVANLIKLEKYLAKNQEEYENIEYYAEVVKELSYKFDEMYTEKDGKYIRKNDFKIESFNFEKELAYKAVDEALEKNPKYIEFIYKKEAECYEDDYIECYEHDYHFDDDYDDDYYDEY